VTAAEPLRPRNAGTAAGTSASTGAGGASGDHPLQSALAALNNTSAGSQTGSRPRSPAGLHASSATPSVQPLVRLGRYQVVSRIATGGMAEVYLAVHGELSGFRTPVVLKKVLPHLACNSHFIDMFLDEARIASLLDHPNVVRIYEVGRTGNEYFLAMELVQGKPMSALVRRAHERNELVDHRIAAHVVAQAAAGLHHAHGQTDPLGNPLGLVHRDVSPQNILVSFEGSVKVIDFGIARALGRISDTQTGGTKGKFGYMSPEQAKGEDVDLRTDIFALGVVLWEAVCGRRLFQRENDLATMRALIYDPIPKPSTIVPIAAELESIILRALSRNPKLRFQSAREMATALEKFVISSGGVSSADLGSLLKTYFASDVIVWQQTLRNAMSMPAAPEAEAAPAVGTTSPSPQPKPRARWPLFTALGIVAVGIATAIVMWTPGDPTPPSGEVPAEAQPSPSAPAAVAPPAPAPTVEPLPKPGLPDTTERPTGANNTGNATNASNDRAAAATEEREESRRSRRRSRSRDRSGPTPAPAPSPDQRRPNPF
jgi:serine/threonine-protein kinase